MVAEECFWIWIGIFSFIACASASPTVGSTTVTVPLSDLRIQASAICCLISADPVCIEEQCPIAHQLSNAADEDALTELTVDSLYFILPGSENYENGPHVQYSFFLKQVIAKFLLWLT